MNYSHIFWFFGTTLNSKSKKNCDERMKILFPRSLLVIYWIKFAFCKYYQRLKIVTTYIHFISCIDKSSISLKRVKCLVIKKIYNFAIEYEMSKPWKKKWYTFFKITTRCMRTTIFDKLSVFMNVQIVFWTRTCAAWK